jgi:hypothetical protein
VKFCIELVAFGQVKTETYFNEAVEGDLAEAAALLTREMAPGWHYRLARDWYDDPLGVEISDLERRLGLTPLSDNRACGSSADEEWIR